VLPVAPEAAIARLDRVRQAKGGSKTGTIRRALTNGNARSITGRRRCIAIAISATLIEPSVNAAAGQQ
jgi:hypothetical protein